MNASEARACLGVDADATLADAQAAYRHRAAMLHPDKHATAAGGIREEAARAMRQLNEALSVLRQPSAAEREPMSSRPPLPDECRMCGCTPAAPVLVRKVTGLALGHQVKAVSGALCRGCGMAMWRDAQGSTLVRGWWGVLAWARTLLVLWTNLGARRVLMRLEPPNARAENVEAFLAAPHPATRPLPRRPGVWAASLTFLLVALSIMGAALEPERPAAPDAPAPEVREPDSPQPGTCFDSTGSPTGCDFPGAVLQFTNSANSAAGCVAGDVFLAYNDRPGGVCVRSISP